LSSVKSKAGKFAKRQSEKLANNSI